VKISSVQGQCFYPAGHLYHYVPVYLLYLYTDRAEDIVKLIHHLMHSMTLYYVAKLSYGYFRKNRAAAQLICFMLLSNQEVREFNQMLFNDSITVLYVAMAIFYLLD